MEGCSEDVGGASEREKVMASVWDAPPHGLLEHLLETKGTVSTVRLLNSKWCSEIDGAVKRVGITIRNLPKEVSEERLRSLFAKYPGIEGVHWTEPDSLEPIAGVFGQTLLRLTLDQRVFYQWDILPKFSKLETLEVRRHGLPNHGLCNDQIGHLSTMTTLRNLVVYEGRREIAHLDTLSRLTNLEKLDLSGVIPTLHPIEPLTKLTELRVSGYGCYITKNIRVVSALTNLESLHLFRISFDDDDAHCLSHLVNLRGLHMGLARLGDAGFRHVSHLTKLSYLAFPIFRFTEAGLDPISCSRNLEYLKIGGIRICGPMQRGHFLTPLTNFRTLILEICVADGVVHSIASLSCLTHLHFCVSWVTNDAFQTLGNLGELKSLSVWSKDRPIEIGPLSDWPCLPELRKLEMYGFSWMDEELVHLSRLKRLEELHLECENVTNVGLLQVTKLTWLKKLEWYCSNVSNQCDGRILKVALPHCEIDGSFVY